MDQDGRGRVRGRRVDAGRRTIQGGPSGVAGPDHVRLSAIARAFRVSEDRDQRLNLLRQTIVQITAGIEQRIFQQTNGNQNDYCTHLAFFIQYKEQYQLADPISMRLAQQRPILPRIDPPGGPYPAQLMFPNVPPPVEHNFFPDRDPFEDAHLIP